jgi:hypothetical protein
MQPAMPMPMDWQSLVVIAWNVAVLLATRWAGKLRKFILREPTGEISFFLV